MFNYTSRYLDDILTINNPEFEKKNSDKYGKSYSWTKHIETLFL